MNKLVDYYQKQKESYVAEYSRICSTENITDIQRKINWCDLKLAELAPFEVKIEFISNKCCTECSKLDGKVISIKEAIEGQPLPYEYCTRENGCYCCYGITTIRDKNDRLIRKINLSQ